MKMSQEIEHDMSLPTPFRLRPPHINGPLPIVKKNEPRINVDTPTNTLELYKKYLSCLCAVCITCIVLTVSLLIHLLRDSSADSFQVLRSQVLDVKDSDLSSCQVFKKKNKSSEPPLFLTKLIEEERFQEAQSLSKVKGVLVDVPSYSGYITVDKRYQSNLFFWFIPKETRADTGPLVLWLQGGPGWPSMFGMFKENGPFLLDVNKEGGKIK